MISPAPTPTTIQAPVADLLGDEDSFTPYVQAINVHSPVDDDFGQFQEASVLPNQNMTLSNSA